MALASSGQPIEAVASFEAGLRKAPRDKRFPIELAGLAFRAKDPERAKHLLHQALHIDASDTYANDFLATLYFLDGNIEAALKYWNRTGKPIVQTVTSEPTPRLDPALLDRAFTFAPGSPLTLRQLRETEQRIQSLHIYPSYRFEIVARPDEKIDVVFRNTERNGWGNSKLKKLVNLFGSLPFQTITPEAFNIRGAGANFTSLYRFDAQKRRLFSSFSAPLQGNPKWRYGVSVDLRKENWNLAYPSYLSGARNFTLEKLETTAQIGAVVSPNWRWTSAVSVANRRYSNVSVEPGTGDAAFARDFLQGGATVKYATQLEGAVIRIPEKRFSTTAVGRIEFGKWWARPAQSFAKVQGRLRAQWTPRAKGDDYALTGQFSAGKIFGAVPLDELSTMGMDGESDLWLRGHAVVHDGKKGFAPMGRKYVLFNSEWDKNVYSGTLFSVKLGPFLDSGRISDPSAILGSRQWLVDSGVQIKVRVLGAVGITLSYGYGLVDGEHAFHASALR